MGVSEHWFSKRHLKGLRRAWERDLGTPVPTQVVSNGEYLPPPQTRAQKEVEARIQDRAERMARRLGVTRRDFLRSAAGMAACFLSMNEVYGGLFEIDAAEAAEPERADARLAALKDQFILDGQTHHVADDYKNEGLLFLRKRTAGENVYKKVLNPALAGQAHTLDAYKFESYVKDIFMDSDTRVALLSSFTSDDPERIPLTDEEMVATRDKLNRMSGSRRLLAQGFSWPGFPGNLESMERAAKELKIDSWKSYTVGDPGQHSNYPFFLDDERKTYPSYELADKLGIRNWCTHKGLLPVDYRKFRNWEYADLRDLPKAARDWPQLNFIIFHAAIRPGFDDGTVARLMEEQGEIPWIDDMAAMRSRHGLENVYADVGSTFASAVVTQPRLCAAIMAKLIAGCGYDRVLWGTDSVWYGSPQWQIEGLRRLQIPDDIARKTGLSRADQEDFNANPDGRVKSAIFGKNAVRLYGLPATADGRPAADYANDGLARVKAEYLRSGAQRDNLYYGWIRKEREPSA
jgi:predicted TIM-barrel fold metal-dependent hydrolase